MVERVPSDDPAPAWLRPASDIAWRLLAVAALVVVLALGFSRLRVVLLPVIFALMLASLLLPLRRALERRGLPRPVAGTFVLAMAAILLGSSLTWLATTLVNEMPALRTSFSTGVDEVARWAVEGPLRLPQTQVDEFLAQVRSDLASSQQSLLHGALSNAPLALEVSIGAVLTLVLTAFFVLDGEALASGTLAFCERWFSGRTAEIAARVWTTVTAYTRGVLLNGLLNSSVIGGGLWVLGVPLALPVAALTFIGSFVPILGGVIAGGIAVSIALASKGFGTAVVVVALALIVHAIEAYVVGPLVLGRAVHLHPLTVLIAVSVGSAVAGVTGAIVAVPLMATMLTVLGAHVVAEAPGDV